MPGIHKCFADMGSTGASSLDTFGIKSHSVFLITHNIRKINVLSAGTCLHNNFFKLVFRFEPALSIDGEFKSD